MAIATSLLTAEDWAIWRDLRLEMLQLDPTAFGSTLAEERSRDEASWRDVLNRSRIHIVSWNGVPVGAAGVFRPDARPKRRHRGTLFGVYLRADHRGKGLADALIRAVCADAARDYTQLTCTVTAGNESARRLYEKHGFAVYATDRGSLCTDGVYADEYLMRCDLAKG